MKQTWARVKFEHRFRLEQRWFARNDVEIRRNEDDKI
jgi:hypothetical protein